jgi:hypothetical protein
MLEIKQKNKLVDSKEKKIFKNVSYIDLEILAYDN